MKQKFNFFFGVFFVALTFIFIISLIINDDFFYWAFERHQNSISWYIRPLLLIPFSYFSYKRKFIGISISLFALITSMSWFPTPSIVDENIKLFLDFEKKYLLKNWNFEKIILVLTIPFSLILLIITFWKRNLFFGIILFIIIALGKIYWSIDNAGESGKTILVPAIIGIIICSFSVYYLIKHTKD